MFRATNVLAHVDRPTVEEAKAAMEASESKSHSFFKDRNHSGKIEAATRVAVGNCPLAIVPCVVRGGDFRHRMLVRNATMQRGFAG